MARISTEERFWNKVSKDNNGCWLWLGARSGRGWKQYGSFWNGTKLICAHRYAYEYKNGVIPEGLQLDHLCRHRLCVNPMHLELVTNQENCQRGNTGLHNLIKFCCPKGHKYSPQNTYLYHCLSGHIKRCCRICHAQREAKRRLNVPDKRQ